MRELLFVYFDWLGSPEILKCRVQRLTKFTLFFYAVRNYRYTYRKTDTSETQGARQNGDMVRGTDSMYSETCVQNLQQSQYQHGASDKDKRDIRM